MNNLSHIFTLEFSPDTPDLVFLKVTGDFEAEDINALFDTIDRKLEGLPYWFLELDISELGHASPLARRAGAERVSQTPEYSVALYGGALAQRAISTLFLKVAELFGNNRDVVNKFFKDRESARRWLASERRRREAKQRQCS